MSKDQIKDNIRSSGVEVRLSIPTEDQPKQLTESNVIKMVEDNMDILVDSVESGESDIDVVKLFTVGAE